VRIFSLASSTDVGSNSDSIDSESGAVRILSTHLEPSNSAVKESKGLSVASIVKDDRLDDICTTATFP
jgi:hypothetical protein